MTASSTLTKAAVLAAVAAPVTVEETQDGGAWDAGVASRHDASIYHRWAWRRIFEQATGHRTCYLIARRGRQAVGGLPLVEFRSRLFGRFAVSLPYVNYGGIAAADAEVADALVAAGVEWSRTRDLSHLELRHVGRRAPAWPERRHKVSMQLALASSTEAQWAVLNRKVRNLVRKAERSGFTTVEGGLDLVPEFHAVFAHNMRDLGTPIHGRRFFEAVVGTLGAAARVFVVRLDAQPVAASITLAGRDSIEVPWASSLRAFNDRAPNMLLYWRMLAAAVAAKQRTFDFGRSTPGEGTFHFKRQWGAVPVPLVWEYPGLQGTPPDQGPKNPTFRMAISMWRRLPVGVATRLGPRVITHIP